MDCRSACTSGENRRGEPSVPTAPISELERFYFLGSGFPPQLCSARAPVWQSKQSSLQFSIESDPPAPRLTMCARWPVAHEQPAPQLLQAHPSRMNTARRNVASASPLSRTRPVLPATPERMVISSPPKGYAAPHRSCIGIVANTSPT